MDPTRAASERQGQVERVIIILIDWLFGLFSPIDLTPRRFTRRLSAGCEDVSRLFESLRLVR